MDFFENRYYSRNRFYMRLICQWPYQNRITRILGSSFIIFNFILGVIFQIAALFTEKRDIDFVALVLQNVMSCCSFIANVCPSCIFNKEMKELIDQIECDWKMIQASEELKIITDYTDKARLCTLILTSFFWSAYGFFMATVNVPYVLDVLVPLNESRNEELFLPAYYFVDQKKYFLPILLHMHLIVTLGTMVTLTFLPMYICYIQHACGMFTIVGYQLEHAFDESNQGIYSEIDRANIIYEENIKICRSLNFHNKAIRFANNISACYAPVYFAQLVFTLLHLTIDMFRTMVIMKDYEEGTVAALQVLLTLLCISSACYTGQRLVDHSGNVFTKACQSKWFQGSTKAQKLLILVIIRSAKPCAIAVTKSLSTTYQMFGTILRTALSYFMVLYSLK